MLWKWVRWHFWQKKLTFLFRSNDFFFFFTNRYSGIAFCAGTDLETDKKIVPVLWYLSAFPFLFSSAHGWCCTKGVRRQRDLPAMAVLRPGGTDTQPGVSRIPVGLSGTAQPRSTLLCQPTPSTHWPVLGKDLQELAFSTADLTLFSTGIHVQNTADTHAPSSETSQPESFHFSVQLQ